MRPLAGLAAILVSLSTALAITAVVILPFLTPAWVAFEQGRADAPAWTGFDPADLRAATDAILGDLVVGPPAFDVAVGGVPVLTAPERSHMRDVRGVFAAFYLLAGAGLVVLAAARLAASRSASWTRLRFWRAVRRGAAGLAIVIAVAGAAAAVAFDALFGAFHSLFFAAGTYDFDPRVYRLTQLFPDAFWSETSIVVGAAILAAAVVTAVVASHRLGAGERTPVATLAAAAR